MKTNKEIKEQLGIPDSAFPTNQLSTGLSKREYFAAAAMQGLLAAGNRLTATVDAVKYADRLMQELNKLPESDNQ